jgi:hypothetical protein
MCNYLKESANNLCYSEVRLLACYILEVASLVELFLKSKGYAFQIKLQDKSFIVYGSLLLILSVIFDNFIDLPVL